MTIYMRIIMSKEVSPEWRLIKASSMVFVTACDCVPRLSSWRGLVSKRSFSGSPFYGARFRAVRAGGSRSLRCSDRKVNRSLPAARGLGFGVFKGFRAIAAAHHRAFEGEPLHGYLIAGARCLASARGSGVAGRRITISLRTIAGSGNAARPGQRWP